MNVFISVGELRAYGPGSADAGADASVAADATVESGTTDAARGPTVDGGCGLSGALTGQFTANVTIGGTARTYTVIVPSNNTSSGAVPLAFVLHGLNQFSSDAIGYGLQNAAATAGNVAVFVFPQALSGPNVWDLSCAGNDVAFFDAIRAQLASSYCIQPGKVFVTGFSAGGDFANALGCCRGNVIRAIAPSSGGFYSSGCTAQAPAFRLTSGASDPIYQQFEFVNGLSYYQAANHCSVTAIASGAAPCFAYTGCTNPVMWCNYACMPHQLPPTWAADTWGFFSSF